MHLCLTFNSNQGIFPKLDCISHLAHSLLNLSSTIGNDSTSSQMKFHSLNICNVVFGMMKSELGSDHPVCGYLPKNHPILANIQVANRLFDMQNIAVDSRVIEHSTPIRQLVNKIKVTLNITHGWLHQMTRQSYAIAALDYHRRDFPQESTSIQTKHIENCSDSQIEIVISFFMSPSIINCFLSLSKWLATRKGSVPIGWHRPFWKPSRMSALR